MSAPHSAPYFVGIDSGLSVTKSAVWDAEGQCLAVAAVPSRHEMLPDGLVETDPEEQWRAAARATRTAVREAGVAAAVAAVGVSSHGDCVYLVDDSGTPVRPAIPSLDFRGAQIARGWRRTGVSRRFFEITGELPHPHHIHATLAWLRDHEPESLAAARWVLFAKDWLKLRLTDTVTTDPTDATAGFMDLRAGGYSDDALAVCGLSALRAKLPPILPSATTVGALTEEAAESTGLAPGTPVAGGVHDISAAALGCGLADAGTALLIAGTYSVNVVLSDRPHPDERWLCREWALPGRWLHMSTSATSASNLSWLLDQLGPGQGGDDSQFAAMEAEVANVLDEDPAPVFHPFLYGIPGDERASAALLGLRPWHRRAHIYRAVLEGIAFSHRMHLEALADCAPVTRVLLAGGATRSTLWSQLFADALGLPVEVKAVAEHGSLGAAMCAAAATGAMPSLEHGVAKMTPPGRTYLPADDRRDHWEHACRRYAESVRAAPAMWTALSGPPSEPRSSR